MITTYIVAGEAALAAVAVAEEIYIARRDAALDGAYDEAVTDDALAALEEARDAAYRACPRPWVVTRQEAEESAPTLCKLRNAPQPLDEDAEDDAREIGDSPRRPTEGTRVVFVEGESQFTGERRRQMTIEEADFAASEIMGEETQMRLNEDVRVDGAVPHTMRGSFIWIEEVASADAAADDE